MKTKHSTSAQTPHISCQAQWLRCDDLGLFCCHRNWTPWSHFIDHQRLLESNVRPSVWQLKVVCNWMQQDSYTSKAATEWLTKKIIKMLQWIVKIKTWTWLKYCGGTFRELCMNEHLQTSMKWSNDLLNDAIDWYTENYNFKSLLLKVVLWAQNSIFYTLQQRKCWGFILNK